MSFLRLDKRKEELENYEKANTIAEEVVGYARKMDLLNRKVLDITEELENVIRTLGGKPAWPVNILINDIAAHYTPDVNETLVLKENDLVKVDIGVQVNLAGGTPANMEGQVVGDEWTHFPPASQTS
jgi:methionine aminopeptidase